MEPVLTWLCHIDLNRLHSIHWWMSESSNGLFVSVMEMMNKQTIKHTCVTSLGRSHLPCSRKSRMYSHVKSFRRATPRIPVSLEIVVCTVLCSILVYGLLAEGFLRLRGAINNIFRVLHTGQVWDLAGRRFIPIWETSHASPQTKVAGQSPGAEVGCTCGSPRANFACKVILYQLGSEQLALAS